MILTARVGYSCAVAATAVPTKAARASKVLDKRLMFFLPSLGPKEA
jgi:hypothetical protein